MTYLLCVLLQKKMLLGRLKTFHLFISILSPTWYDWMDRQAELVSGPGFVFYQIQKSHLG